MTVDVICRYRLYSRFRVHLRPRVSYALIGYGYISVTIVFISAFSFKLEHHERGIPETHQVHGARRYPEDDGEAHMLEGPTSSSMHYQGRPCVVEDTAVSSNIQFSEFISSMNE